jgi:hypothetical protein
MTGRRHRVLALVDDLMVRSRLEAAAGTSTELIFPVTTVEAVTYLEQPFDLVLIGMAATRLPWDELIAAHRVRHGPASAQIVAFGPHKDLALRERALRAGADRVLANSALMIALPRLLAGEPVDLNEADA